MADPLQQALTISGAGMSAETQRLRVVSENIANANTTSLAPEIDPYRRKTITFASELDRSSGISMVKVVDVNVDKSPFVMVHNPSHSAADEFGMVKTPNVDILLEMADMRETLRSYEANMQAVKQARNLISMTIDMMRG